MSSSVADKAEMLEAGNLLLLCTFRKLMNNKQDSPIDVAKLFLFWLSAFHGFGWLDSLYRPPFGSQWFQNVQHGEFGVRRGRRIRFLDSSLVVTSALLVVTRSY